LVFEKFDYEYISSSADKNRLQNRGEASNGWGEPWKAHWVMGMDGITPGHRWKINGGADVFLQRKFVTTFPNVKDAVYWLSFSYQNLTKNQNVSSNEPQWGTIYFDLGGGTKMFVGSTKNSGRKVGMMDDWGSKVNSEYADTLENVVVVKIVMSGSGANNKAYLFVNPKGTAEPADADAVGSMGWWTNGQGIDQMFIGARNPFSVVFDNIRFATTYEATNIGVGIKDNALNNTEMYPNPANDFIFINNLPANNMVSVYGISGSLLKMERNVNAKLNVSDLTNGVYFLKVQSENNSITRKFVINR